jgi:hypothetical protein
MQVDPVGQALLLDADQYRAPTKQPTLELQHAEQVDGANVELDPSLAPQRPRKSWSVTSQSALTLTAPPTADAVLRGGVVCVSPSSHD